MTDIAHKLNQARELMDRGRFAQARDTLQRVIRHAPGDKQANVLMRHALTRLGEPRQALYYAERALAGAPEDPELITLAALSQADAGEPAAARARLEACVGAHPGSATARAALARMYLSEHRLGDCLRTCGPALEGGQNDPRLLSAYASALLRVGRADEAMPIMKHLVASGPSGVEPVALSHLAGAMLLDPTADGAELFAAHHAFGRVLAQAAPAGEPDWAHAGVDGGARAMDPDRKLRVGFMLPTARGCPAGGFIEPVVERLDRRSFEVLVYSTAGDGGGVGASCRAAANLWRDASRMSPAELCLRARQDRVDVAIDMSGHMPGSSLVALHLRCAPVQAHWWVYPFTTGLAAVDHRITDSLCVPAGGAAEKQSPEGLVRIDPCGACYRPAADAPGVDPEPPSARTGGRVTFVSFSAAERMNAAVVRAWARVLKEARNARLVLRHPSLVQADTRSQLAQRLAAAGAAPDMVSVEGPRASTSEALAGYNEADVALDTFPLSWAGGVCEALWMGVPVVGMEGDLSHARASRSVMHAAGLDDLVARDEDGYVERAIGIAGDVERRRRLRAGLRATLEGSALRDEAGFARKFENAVREMWRARCARG